MNHQRGECFLDPQGEPSKARLLWNVRAQGGSELPLDIGDDYGQALRDARDRYGQKLSLRGWETDDTGP